MRRADSLAFENLTVNFGGLVAIRELNLRISSNCIHSLIGPNGAGKTTLINCLSGFVPSSGGVVRFEGNVITGLPAHRIAALGIARTFQNICLFPGMTVLENVLVGGHRRFRASFLDLVLRRSNAAHEEAMQIERARAALAFVGLELPENKPAIALSYGHQRLLEIARALAVEPKVLLLDEPMAGMNLSEKEQLAEIIRCIRANGTTVVLIEHDVQVVKALSDQVSVLFHGQKIADGTPVEVFSDPAVQRAYLGRTAA